MTETEARPPADPDVGQQVVELAEALVALRDEMPIQYRWSAAAKQLANDAERFIKNARAFGLAAADWS